MYLSERRLKALSRVLQTLAEPHEEREIRARLGEQLLELLQAQYYASYVWRPDKEAFEGQVQLNMDPSNLLRYERYFQFHDPITLSMQRYRRAVCASEVLPREALLRTEFFNDFLARDGLHWGVNLYAWEGETNIGDLRIWRDRRHEDFSDEDLRLLDLVRPAFVAALSRARAPRPPAAEPTAHAASILSARERDVARLAACGLSDKEIARQLGISMATVRTHFDHAFRKLGVDNRMKLIQRLGL